MRQHIRDISIYAVLLAVVIGGIWFYRNYKEDVLDYSLNHLRTRLLAMVPQEEHKPIIAEKYNAFTEKIREQRVSPEHMETVAANILNLSRNNAKLTPEQVDAILMISDFPKIQIEIQEYRTDEGVQDAVDVSEDFSVPEIDISDIPVVPNVTAPRSRVAPKPAEPEQLAEAGKRLKSVCEFDKRLEKIVEANKHAAVELHRNVHFQNENGLKIAIDPGAKLAMKKMAIENLNKEIKRLEQEDLIAWQKDLKKELAREMRRIRMELLSLERLIKREAAAYQNNERVDFKVLLDLKELEAMNYIRELKLDSVMTVYREKMDEQARLMEEKARLKRKAKASRANN